MSKKQGSVYFAPETKEKIERHVFSVVVDNEPGVLARVIGLFSGRGYNIDSLNVAEVDHVGSASRISIVTTGTRMALEQIKAQVARLVPVHYVRDLTVEGEHAARELALVKVYTTSETRAQVVDVARQFRALMIHEAAAFCVFEIVDDLERVEEFVRDLRKLGEVRLSRSGIVAISLEE